MIDLVDGIFEDLPGLLRVLRVMPARWAVDRSVDGVRSRQFKGGKGVVLFLVGTE